MKKSSKILGSIALSAALVMGTAAPAFADNTTGANSDSANELNGTTVRPDVDVATNRTTLASDADSEAAGSSTIVKASTYTSQLNVTIPLVLPLKFDTVGGPGMAPKDDAYYIKNNSATDITVTQAEYKIADTAANDWGFGTDAYASGTNATSTKAVGDVYIKLHPTTGTEASADLELKGGRTANAAGNLVQDSLKWGISAKNPTTGASTKYGFKVEPSSSLLKKSVNDATTMASIIYTVSVGAEQASGNDSELTAGVVPAAGTATTYTDLLGLFTAVDSSDDFVTIQDESGNPVTSGDVWVKTIQLRKNMAGTNLENVSAGAQIVAIGGGNYGYVVTVSTTAPTA